MSHDDLNNEREKEKYNLISFKSTLIHLNIEILQLFNWNAQMFYLIRMTSSRTVCGVQPNTDWHSAIENSLNFNVTTFIVQSLLIFMCDFARSILMPSNSISNTPRCDESDYGIANRKTTAIQAIEMQVNIRFASQWQDHSHRLQLATPTENKIDANNNYRFLIGPTSTSKLS